MKLPRTQWGKRAIVVMIAEGLDTKHLAAEIGVSPQYCAGVLHGRIYSPNTINAISTALNITNSDEPQTLTVEV